jgi:hypothetical protein
MKRIAHITNGCISNVSLADDSYVCKANEMLESAAVLNNIPYCQVVSDGKAWADVRRFMDTFTPEEKALISLSTDPVVASLRLDIATWPDRVLLGDARVQLGLSRLVETNIISSERRLEIEGTAS